MVQVLRVVAVFRLAIAADRPPRDAFDASLDPPAIEHRKLRHTVHARFHAARAGRLERALRGVEPHIRSRDHIERSTHVVVGHEGGAYHALERADMMVQILDQALARRVARMRLARENELKRLLSRDRA
ncbi:hypothetical protein D3C83_15040 [compost metagenome]